MAKTKDTKCYGPKGKCVAPTLCKAVGGCAADALAPKDGPPPAKPGDRTKPARRPKY